MNIKELWESVSPLLDDGKEEKALVLLYTELNHNLSDIGGCDSFLLHVMQYDLSSDVIVHILNALSPIKYQLTNWGKFEEYVTSLLINKLGKEYTNNLLKVII